MERNIILAGRCLRSDVEQIIIGGPILCGSKPERFVAGTLVTQILAGILENVGIGGSRYMPDDVGISAIGAKATGICDGKESLLSSILLCLQSIIISAVLGKNYIVSCL